MLLLRLLARLSLWLLVAALGVHAYMATVRASALDARVPQGLLVCGLAAAVGCGLAWLDGRRAARRASAGDDAGVTSGGGPGPGPSLPLVLLVLFLAATAFSHVGPHTSIKVLREEVPLELAWLHPLLCLAAPLLLARSAPRVDRADQLLLLALGTCVLDGAFLFLPDPAALALAVTALLAQWGEDGRRLPRSALLLAGGAFVVLMGVATALGENALTAAPSWRWIVASAALGLAVALRPRDGDDWRRILAAPTVTAVLVAVGGAVLTAYLAQAVHPDPALNTRLYLFRQHPNFLAPFFLFHGLIAAGLGLTRGGRSRLWLVAALLLFASTVLTDSNTGKAALVLGVAAVPALYVLRRVARVIPLKLVVAVLLAVPLVGGVAVVLGGQDPSSFLGSRIERFEKSVDYRADAWRNSLHIVERHPLIGIGPHTFLSVDRFKPGSRFFNEEQPPHPHNVALYVAQAGGIGALLAVLAWWLLLFRSLWRTFAAVPRAAGSPPALLAATVLAAILALLAANTLDLGLALLTVVPGPLFALTGLAAADRAERRSLRRGPAALCGAALLALLLHSGLAPLHARTLMEKAHLLAFDSSRTGDAALMQDAHDAVRHALRLDPTTPRAHEVLSRWLESTEGGLRESLDLLLQLIALAPQDGAGRGLLAQLYMRADMHREAADELATALSVGHGSVHQNRDRADRIWCLARIGERETAERALFDAIRLDRGVIVNMTWSTDGDGNKILRVGGDAPQPPIELVTVVQSILHVNLADEAAGREVSRNTWMDTYHSFRDAGRDDLALICLDHIEAHVEGIREEGTLSSERARIAEAAGDLERAYELFNQAYEESGQREFFKQHAARVALKMGLSDAASASSTVALTGTGEILDLPTAFRDFFQTQSATFLAEGRLLEAADRLHRTLLFQDDIVERARILLRVAELCNDGGDHATAAEVALDALDHLHAKPFPAALLHESETVSLPGRLAAQLGRAWAGQGLDPGQRLRRAWSWPHFFSSRAGPSLFRLAFFEGNGQADALLKEARLQLLQRPDELLAMWGELTALEAFGAWGQAGQAMRNLAERFGETHDLDRIWTHFVDIARRQPEDPHVLFRAGILKLLSGQYAQAADFFHTARSGVTDQPGREADLLGWQARALVHAGRRQQARDVLGEAVAIDPGNLMLQRRWQALGGGAP